MLRVKINPVLANFKKAAKKSLDLSKEANRYKVIQNRRILSISKRRIHLINEYSFLNLYLSWEYFLEEAFIRFLCGAQNSNALPKTRYVRPYSLKHARDVIKQNQRYIDWTAGNVVIDRAKLYFKDGEPFNSALGSCLNELTEMKKIRNRIAHSSKEVRESYQQLVRQKLGHHPMSPRGMIPGRFLMCKFPPTNPNTLLETYGDTLDAAAEIIIC